MNYDFRKENLSMWETSINDIFSDEIPKEYEWTNLDDIVEVLNKICKPSLNHMFLPDGGGEDITKVTLSHEKGCINIYDGCTFFVIKPSKLIFNSFNGADEWAYFRIETFELEDSGVYESNAFEYEEVVYLNKGQKYIRRDFWDRGFYYNPINGEEIRFNADDTIALRYFRGSFVIFAKKSIYNSINETYDGRHNKMNNEEFREYIGKAVTSIEKKISKK